MPRPVSDLDLAPSDVAKLSSVDALADFFAKLGYDTNARQELSAESIGLAGAAAEPIQSVELIAEDEEGLLRIVFVRLRSLTAKSRNEIAKVLGRTNVDHLLVLTSDFAKIEFVLIFKSKREARGPAGAPRIDVVPLRFAVDRKAVGSKELRTLRRFTFAQSTRDALDQYDKLRIEFEKAHFAEDFFINRLFADYYLLDRLKSDPAWSDNPTPAFHETKRLLDDASSRLLERDEETVRRILYDPLFQALGFVARSRGGPRTEGETTPDYVLFDAEGETPLATAFAYGWDRSLDGSDYALDRETADENPSARVVGALADDRFDWIVLTNGRQWRLYWRNAHSRATDFYEVDLVEALLRSGETDPNESFRYWWLFFRAAAFQKDEATQGERWLDRIADESADYAKGLEERLKDRIFNSIFRHLARGFLLDRRQRLGVTQAPTEDELGDVYQATLTLLYRLLFILYAESRDLLPVRQAPYFAESLKRMKEEIAEKGGVAESEREVRLAKAYSAEGSLLYERLSRLFAAVDQGDSVMKVPAYNGGLFETEPASEKAADPMQERERRIARFLADACVPDRDLALALDLLARDEDPKTFSLVFIDYKSLDVRRLGSVYEGLLEFQLKIAQEDLSTKKVKGSEKYVALSSAAKTRGKAPGVEVPKGDVYLANDKSERKASGSYYTPEPIVRYIVEQTVGPVLDEKLEGLRKRFRESRKTYDKALQDAKVWPKLKSDGVYYEPREFALERLSSSHLQLVEEFFDFRTLDPAMGSGHFLVHAVDFLTDRMLAFLSQFPVNPVQATLGQTRQIILEALARQGVQVDSEKLDDVNLLKRNVLKRCIYGVDLNPMAVELAKVSLWLHAFTLGAPLSFLDHHLRCGNSLIGTRMAELKHALRRSLLGYQLHQLEKATREAGDLNRKPDSTIEEVKESEALYQESRQLLSGYKIGLDLLTAEHFGVPEGRVLLEFHGEDVDLASRAKFYEKLDLTQRAMAEKVERVARDENLRFFHWEIEFPECFFGFEDVDQRRLKHLDELAPGSAGFDAVVGNPPYVRMESKSVKSLKPFLKRHYRCHAERADLFIYFYERAMQLVRAGRHTAFIASSTWTKTKAGENLREFLRDEHTLISYLDFGDLPVFKGATTYPCILVAQRGKPDPGHQVGAAVVRDLEQTDYDGLIASGVHLDQSSLDPAGWRFEDQRLRRLFDKIRNQGVPLKELCRPPMYGIKTGLNEAFVISSETREWLISTDPGSEELLKPYVEGRDLRAWTLEWRGLWLIYPPERTDIGDYPAIRDYLKTFKPALERRATSGSHQWFELQQPQFKYSKAMSGPKILYPDITAEPRFVLDKLGFFMGTTVFFLPTDDRYILGLLHSNVLWWYLSRSVRLMRGNYLRLKNIYVEELPVARRETDTHIATLADALSEQRVENRIAIELELQDRVAALYGLTPDERKIVAGLAYSTPAVAFAEEDE